ncbi:hypothetical protein IP87_18165 [beta proteobacterium AAP121]|nr:hypothetical protein IP80_06875 [beta proteobacterium AAP65]KPF94800.1 hypothetical protein IP87_18165 [beta proteobacterium AAP121]
MSIKFKKSTGGELKFAGKADSTGTVHFPAGTKQQKWTDTIKILSPGLMIGYRERPGEKYPTTAQRELLLNAASSAREIMRTAVREMDRVVFFRRPEGQAFTNIMNYHFGLATGRSPGLPATNVVDKSFSLGDLGKTDRRWALNKIRQGMLSISFHLNTGMYLIDIDNSRRTLKSGVAGTPGANEEGYATWADFGGFDKGALSAWRNGEIHVAFEMMHSGGYSAEHVARVIIHEAAHKYLGVTDKLYCWQGGYDALPFTDCIDNADSYAWAALSLNMGFLLRGIDSHDNKAYPGNIA